MKIIYLALIICIVVVGIFVSTKPRNNKQWEEDFKVLTNVEVSDEYYTFDNVRDWQWNKSGAVSKNYTQKTLNINELDKVWFLLQPFDSNKRLAHTFLTFDFTNGDSIVLSIEARREDNEKYNGLLGVFKKYEIMYMWGTENDLLLKRAVYDNQTVYMYPLNTSDQFKKQLFINFVNKTNSLYTKPEFYNTLTSNCTNSLAMVANQVKPKTVPVHVSWWLTGLSDKYLYNLKYISNNQPFEQKQQSHNVNQFANQNYTNENFNKMLREYLLNNE
jgi:hypothetical protein